MIKAVQKSLSMKPYYKAYNEVTKKMGQNKPEIKSLVKT